MAKVLKIISVILLTIFSIAAALFMTYLIITKDAALDASKLNNIDRNVEIYDDDGNEILNASLSDKRKSVKIEELSDDTINAFIASEDRTFFKHNGLNYKRMLKALYKNIVAGSFKEGASTISQQLIKNTHLTGDKTIKRKLNEIRLTKKLEKRYNKNEILEMYLNTIYFGHNCYGLESAAEFYFDKRAENLDLSESATLVGLLTSPNNFSPFKNPEKSIIRRNTVLNAMLECGFIDENTCAETKAAPINAKNTSESGRYSSYLASVFDELEELNVDFYNLLDGCKIKTYLQPQLQNYIENIEYENDKAVIVTTKSGSVQAYVSTTGGARRQPASTIKPIAVYAPAIEERLLNPCTKIPDEKIDFNGYSPENFDKKYHGLVTVSDCLKYSYNVPAVKILNAMTINRAEKYLSAMNVELCEADRNLSIALGGMKYGLTLKEIADAYTTFPRGGTFCPSRFIKEVELADGTVIYRDENCGTRVFSEGTCSLVNEMLIETAKSGTGKKLKDLEFNVAVKTGTSGNAEGNTDAYAIGYTNEHTVAVWFGDKNNERLSVTGGGASCEALKNILTELYKYNSPSALDTESGTAKIDIDFEEYDRNNRLMIADDLSPAIGVRSVKVLKGNEPKEKSTKFSQPTIKTPSISVNEGDVNIQLCQTKYYAYLIKRSQNGDFEVVYDGKWTEKIVDKPNSGTYTYSVIPYYTNGKTTKYGKEIILPAVNVGKADDPPQIKIPDIVEKNWFDM